MPIIKKVIRNKKNERPIMVYFQNGKIKSDECEKLESALYRNSDGKTIVSITNGNMLYAGVIDNDDLYDNYFLINRKQTDKIRLVQADTCIVSPILNKKDSLMDINIATDVNSVSELNKQFGSKKIKRVTEQQERLKMNIETVKSQLEKTVSDIKIDQSYTTNTSSENDSLYRPKINRNASTIDQVYDIENIVPKNVLESLYKEAKIIIDASDLTGYSLTSFVTANIAKILEIAPDRLKSQRISIFLYINYLIKFMNTPMKNITKKFVVCDKSSEVNNHILNNFSFTTGHNRTRPLSMKDKALCSILVLAALAMDYAVDIEPLSKDYKIGIKKVLEVARVLAFSTSGKNQTVITLKLPLPDPISISMKRKRK